MEPSVKFKQEESGGFFQTLNKRISEYFKENNTTRKATAYGKFKIVLFLATFIGLVMTIYMSNGNIALMISAFAVLGFIQICCALILGHEGVHGAYSKNKTANKLMTFMFDFVGTSGYLWGLRHVHSHHPYTMIPGKDTDIAQTGMLTFEPLKDPKPIFKYQQYYTPFLYLFYTLQVVFKRDFVDFFSNKIGHKTIKHKTKDLVEFLITKAIYFTYCLILPLVLSGAHWGWVLLGFVIMHMVESITAAVALFPAHLYEDSIFPYPDENGEMETTWAVHQLRVTTDFGTRFKIVGFFFGGINYHAVHHLFPDISHVHYHKIQPILEKTCAEFGVEHKVVPSLTEALISHWKLLRKNGVSRENLHHLSEII